MTSNDTNKPREALESRTFRDGAIYIYRRPDYIKPTWMCRLKIPNMKGYVVRSTRTTDEHEAFKFADNTYNQFLVRSLKGEDLNAPSIVKAANAYISRLEPSSARQSIHYKILLIRRVKPFFEKKLFADLDTPLISRLIDHLAKGSKAGKLSPNTIRRTYSDLKHFFNWCVEEGYFQDIPRFPKVLGEQSNRPHFDPKDWAKLTRYLREFVKHNICPDTPDVRAALEKLKQRFPNIEIDEIIVNRGAIDLLTALEMPLKYGPIQEGRIGTSVR